jgi:hypothetical protein
MYLFCLKMVCFILLFTSCEESPKGTKVPKQINRIEAFNLVEEWSGIKKYPVSKSIIQIEERGNMFTRGFLITMNISTEVAQEWIKKEPLLMNIIPEIYNNGIERYDLKINQDGKHGELIIYPDENKVTLKVSRS